MNTAADFLTRLEKDRNEKIIFKLREDFPIESIEVNIESLHKRNRSSLIPQTNKRPQERKFGNVKKEHEMPCLSILQSSPVITVSCYYANDLHKDKTFVSIAQLTKPSRILIEQDSAPTLLIFKREMLVVPFDEQNLLNDARHVQYFSGKKCTIIKDDILCRQYY